MGEKPKEDYLAPETFRKVAVFVIADIQKAYRMVKWKVSIGDYEAEAISGDLKIQIWALVTVPFIHVKITYVGRVVGGTPISNILAKQTNQEIRNVSRVFVNWIKKMIKEEKIIERIMEN